MRANEIERRISALWAPPEVRDARERQTEEDQLELRTLSPAEERAALEDWQDLNTLRLGTAPEDGLLEFLLGLSYEPTRPSEREQRDAAKRLARRWAEAWRLHDPKLNGAIRIVAAQLASLAPFDAPVRSPKEMALEVGIILAMGDAKEPQTTKIGRDHAMALGSEFVLLQKQYLPQANQDGPSDDFLNRLRQPAAGLHVFPSNRILSPIEALLSGFELSEVAPIDLRPAVFLRWVRRRAIAHAEDWLRHEAGIGSCDMLDQKQVTVTQHKMEDLLLEAAERPQLSPLDALIAIESADPFDTVIAAVTPRQEEILELMRDQLAEGLSMPKAKRAVEDLLGFGPTRIDVAFHNVSKRLNDPR